ncbi:MAG TPA: MFS transporter, partial [Candidatus Saccharimonadales bacterium]|nr:MFS transporter [Candidatus Saccharimonadales bacterium]
IAHTGKIVIDYLGAALLAVGLACLVLATSLGGTNGWAWGSAQIISLFTGAAVFLTAFIFAERRAVDPMLPPRFFRSSIFNVISILFLLFGMAFFGAIIYIPTFAQLVLDYNATESGIILLPMVIGLTVGSIAVGQIVNKTGKYKVFIVAGLLIATIGVFTLTGLNTSSSHWDLNWRMALAGLGLGMAMPIFSLAVQNALPQKDLGAATSSIQLFRSIGGTVGLAIMGGLLNNFLAERLKGVSNEPFVRMAEASGQGAQFSNIDANGLQRIISPEAQQAIQGQLHQLPQQAQQPALDSFGHFVHTLQTALASSITEVFMISAGVMAVAFLISFAVKELPLKHHSQVSTGE